MGLISKTYTFSNTPANTNPTDADQVNKNFDDIYTLLSGAPTGGTKGNIDTTNIAASGLTADALADAAKLGLSGATAVRRGSSVIATSENRANAAYGLLATPDRVQNVALPTNGLIVVLFQAVWQGTNGSAGGAAIFVGGNQLKGQVQNNTGPSTAVAEATSGSTVNVDQPLSTGPLGLIGGSGGAGINADVTTGQVVGFSPTTFGSGQPGGPCYIFAAAGTYDVSVQFRASPGSVTVKNRKLWVWTIGF